MAIRVAASPTIVNVITDAVLIVLNLLWLKLMAFLTALDLKRDLRNGQRLYSYEHLGTFHNLRYGVSKQRYLTREKMMDDKLRRHFRLHSLKSLFLLIVAITLVLLHILIDYGLGFDTEATASNETDVYEMMGLQANSKVFTNFEVYRRMVVEEDYCDHPDAPDTCNHEQVTTVIARLWELNRETTVFARTLYNSPSMSDADFLDYMEADYVSLRTDGQPPADCLIRDLTALQKFEGNFEFTEKECQIDESYVTVVQVDGRGRPVVNVRLAAPNAKIQAMYESVGLDYILIQVAYASGKDERQGETSMSIRNVDAPGKNPNNLRTMAMEFDSKLRYAGGQKQTFTTVQLTRRAEGVFAEQDFGLLMEAKVDTPVLDRDPCLALNDAQGRGRLDLRMRVTYQGDFCGEFTPSFASRTCSSYPLAVYDELPNDGIVGIQVAAVTILVDKTSKCGKAAYEKYGSQMDEDVDEDRKQLFLSVVLDIACVRITEADAETVQHSCVYGADRVQFQDGEWKAYKDTTQDSVGVVPIPLRTELTWVGGSVNGGSDAEVAGVFTEMERNLGTFYPEIHSQTTFNMMRGKIFGLKMHESMLAVLAAFSSQLTAVNREMSLTGQESVAVLEGPYLGGVLAVLIISGLACFIVCLRYLQEWYEYRKLGVRVNVPLSITEWVEAALTREDVEDQAPGAEAGGTRKDIDGVYELTAKRIDDPSQQESRSYVAFSENTQPLEKSESS
uniref:Uncharacterized protein n=1 Tax=Rhodosorus marinus TaxID=101924 RepID=A0A7S3A1P4_9RHOD|mmetsp:Transcript_41477/g.163258  ORF Transcript_41477/g.163258 Transcript_41477/m.163258 type:complete len:732 (+) Transcript_41477:402-2597(+)|eukprot:CAMPEP_0113961580 /NCGR_PEP_ID=MMETSP0011_2-20120614/5395_1 /TAXON_ID=101924 /ORGANISM="Rhodosorus marinus" /LENGTH=731 /DNA_ID=CAMNT_0000973251 /DNA_START=226 /DNA_END=2421 /DNA_ORIENTATION=- /assembly_acc=CAM_ASM_000156